MRRAPFQLGDLVVYRRTEHGPSPAPTAIRVAPSRGGDMYSYVVESFSVITAVNEDHTVCVETEDERRFTVREDDLNLRRAGIWERIRYSHRFPTLTGTRTN